MIARTCAIGILVALLACASGAAATVHVDLSRFNPACGVSVVSEQANLQVTWPASPRGEPCSVTLNLEPDKPLFQRLSAAREAGGPAEIVARDVRPRFDVTVGSRKQPGTSPFTFVFFDKPADRPHTRHQAKLSLRSARVESAGQRATVVLGDLAAGPFSGDLRLHFYRGSPLVHAQAVMTPTAKDVAYVYDALLEGSFGTLAWQDLSGNLVRRAPDGDAPQPVAVRHRAIMAETDGRTVAMFPAPHAFFFPRDWSNNYKFAQFSKSAFGLRQDLAGGGAFVPWFDAPEGKPQRMDCFLLLSPEDAEKTLDRVKSYTRGDAFKPIDGRLTFTTHYHARLAVSEMQGKPKSPEFVAAMKAMGVNLVHLAEFHGDGHWDDPGPKRLPEMKAMFDLCRKYSDENLLLIPGEEGIRYLAHPWPPAPRVHPGHWMYLFPRPVYLTFTRREGQPFSEEIQPYGTVYHVGHRDDMVRLLQQENGLAWSSHPRIKASFATPDAFKDQDFYKHRSWLGAAWKAMPGDLSDDRLGRRCLDLLDDMSNWAAAGGYEPKYLPGEVDVFEIDRTHELYGHMNINYLKLAKMPTPDDWSPVLEVLKRGEFFTTTGEVLVHSFAVNGDGVKAELEWTFPLAFAEVIWGDGAKVNRKTVQLPETTEHGRQTFTWPVELKDAKWARLEVWDVARDGAYTQPVRLPR
jgi:hypothetical protein